jgi:hypothetical protein
VTIVPPASYGAPTITTVAPTGTLQLTITWIAPPNPVGIDFYSVYRSTAAPFLGTLFYNNFDLDHLHVTDTSLDATTTYYYTVIAQSNTGGPSVSSAQSTGVRPLNAVTPIMTRSGGSVTLSGSAWRGIGFDLWRANIASWAVSPNTSYFVNDGTTLADSLTSIHAGAPHANVIRSWFFQQYALNNGVRDWSAFDKTLSNAASAGFKVIATLVDHWYFERTSGIDNTLNLQQPWYSGGYKNTILVNERIPYYSWIQEVAAHYANDARIAWWELVNEPTGRNYPNADGSGAAYYTNHDSILAACFDDCAGQLKRIDPNHMVSTGSGGNDYDNGSTSCRAQEASSNLDLISWHAYSSNSYGNASGTNAGGNGCPDRISDGTFLSRPVYTGEHGMALDNSQINENLTTRANYLDAAMGNQFTQGLTAFLPWDWDTRKYSGVGGSSSDHYCYGASDPALPLMDAHHL